MYEDRREAVQSWLKTEQQLAKTAAFGVLLRRGASRCNRRL